MDSAPLDRAHKTHSGVLPQPRTLEVRAADTPQESARNGRAQTAAVQRAQGESAGTASPAVSPGSAPVGPARGVTRVFVLDTHHHPLMPCHPARARQLLARGRARVHRLHPFTIRLVDRTVAQSQVAPLRLKLDPGSKITGVALVRETAAGVQHVLHLAEIQHRGQAVRKHMLQRAQYRHRRRSANLRYRAPRFDNRRRPEGSLAPSLRSRLDNVRSWVARAQRLAPIGALSIELVRFDTQAMENPEIRGVEYQQGTLAGYELRKYLLAKWGRRCAYCGAEGVPLQIEHVVPKSRGGSDRASNLTLACRPCNERKGNRTATEIGHAEVEARATAPRRDAAAINATR